MAAENGSAGLEEAKRCANRGNEAPKSSVAKGCSRRLTDKDIRTMGDRLENLKLLNHRRAASGGSGPVLASSRQAYLGCFLS